MDSIRNLLYVNLRSVIVHSHTQKPENQSFNWKTDIKIKPLCTVFSNLWTLTRILLFEPLLPHTGRCHLSTRPHTRACALGRTPASHTVLTPQFQLLNPCEKAWRRNQSQEHRCMMCKCVYYTKPVGKALHKRVIISEKLTSVKSVKI